MLSRIARELSHHAPFTALGALTGALLVVLVSVTEVPRSVSEHAFWILHPAHVFLSALVTAAMFRRHSEKGLVYVLAIGYVGSVGLATLSDSVIPYLGESLLRMPYREPHIGFVEKWWVVNPVAVLGVLAGYLVPHTKLPHAGHVLVSTYASLFHMTAAMGEINLAVGVVVVAFLFLSVWLPCCTSDIVFPLLFVHDEH